MRGGEATVTARGVGTASPATTTPATGDTTRAPGTRTAVRPPAPRRRWFGPGWPIAALFVGYPLWWVLGISQFAALLAAIPLALELVRRRRIPAPAGFGWWLLFLAWVAVGVAVLQVHAPGAILGGSATRYVTFAYRLCWYLAATVFLLYLGTVRKGLSSLRVTRMLAWMFVVILAGGLAGVTMPHLEFPSVLELLLPPPLANIGFLHSLIHPNLAQVQDFLGYAQPRPSAPFSYTNTWGLNFACFLPFFVAAWLGPDAGWRRRVAPFLLLAALVPVVKSVDRGLWLALIGIALFVAARSAVTGRPRLLATVLVSGLAVVALLFFSPLGNTISDRLAHQHSNEGRASLATLTVTSTLAKSPFVGYGTTRQVQGSFNSINGGATPQCPKCSPPSLGTQGQLWLVTFSQGFGGLVLFVGFLLLQLWRHLRVRSPYVTAALAVLVAQLVTMPVYNSLGIGFVAVFVAVGLLWRDEASPPTVPATSPSRTARTVSGYAALLRRHPAPVVCCVVAGLLAGGGWQLYRGTPTAATVSVLVPAETGYPGANLRAKAVDTDAQLVSSPAVAAAIAQVVGRPVPAADNGLAVTATPNTRILHLTYTADDEATAVRAASAAADAYLRVRDKQLTAREAAQLRLLDVRSAGLESAIRAVGDGLAAADQETSTGRVQPLQGKLNDLLAEAAQVDRQAAEVRSDPLDAGRVVIPPQPRRVLDVWLVALASGLMLGLVAGALWALVLNGYAARLRSARRARALTGLPVLAEVAAPPAGDAGAEPAGLSDAALAVWVQRPAACLLAGGGPQARAVAARLDRVRPPAFGAGPGRTVVLVASRRTRVREVLRVAAGAGLSGSVVAGIVLVTP